MLCSVLSNKHIVVNFDGNHLLYGTNNATNDVKLQFF